MRAVDVIERKRDGHALTREELEYFIQGVVDGAIPDYQASAWCMAVYLRGLNEEETFALTEAMMKTGACLNLSGMVRPTVDKHSTGGVGDKTSLVLVPLLSACGAAVAKMSGRALGHTGGTLDKLESIPGFRTDLTQAEFLAQVEQIGLAIVGQTGALVPADKILYALRDVTGTVPSIPLIAASIMSKKLAAGAGTILLDVKYGSGAILQSPAESLQLARLLVKIGNAAGRKVSACLSSMEQPLGQAVGNALEVKEALATLRGEGSPELRELCLALAAELLYRSGLAASLPDGAARAAQALGNGMALAKMRQMVQAQGGDAAVVDEPERLPSAKATTTILAKSQAYLARVDTAKVGRVAMRLGAGRATKEERIDPAAGISFLVRLGQKVEVGMPVAELHTNRLAEIEPAQRDFLNCLSWSETPVTPPPLFLQPPGSIT